jgi:hypothetical protein
MDFTAPISFAAIRTNAPDRADTVDQAVQMADLHFFEAVSARI